MGLRVRSAWAASWRRQKRRGGRREKRTCCSNASDEGCEMLTNGNTMRVTEQASSQGGCHPRFSLVRMKAGTHTPPQLRTAPVENCPSHPQSHKHPSLASATRFSLQSLVETLLNWLFLFRDFSGFISSFVKTLGASQVAQW